MSQLFHLIVRPLAIQKTPGAFLGGLRIMAVDGTVFDVPDSEANARAMDIQPVVLVLKPHFPKFGW